MQGRFSCATAGWMAILIAANIVGPALAGEGGSQTRLLVRKVDESYGVSLASSSQGSPAAQNRLPAGKPLSSVNLNVMPGQELIPTDVATGEFLQMVPGAAFRSGEVVYPFHWAPSEMVHRPLYFEEAALERYGQTHSPLLQPVISGAHFFGNVAILPYKMGLDLPHQRIYNLGHHRAGSWARSERGHLPWRWRGALFQAGAVVGGVYLFP